tara:strand:+ start:11739 stop:14087 length:2349 start_codon:yes stop_codon:yes gene_type:complete
MKLIPSLSVQRLDSWSKNLVLAVVFLLPLFVLPGSFLSLAASKMGLLALGMLSATFFWALARSKEHRVEYPETNVLWFTALLISGYVVSALLATSVVESLVGFGFERDTVFAMIVFGATMAVVALTTKTVAHFIRLQRTILTSFFILAVFQIARIVVGGDVLLPSIFSSDPTATLLGSWNDLAVFSGLVTIISLTGLALFSARRMRMGLYATLATAVFLLAVVNVGVVWTTLALMSFVLALYIFSDASYDRETGKFRSYLPWKRMFPSIGVLVLSIVFIIAGGTIGGSIANVFNTGFSDIRPSWEGTIQVGSGVFKDNLLFGIGPNAFDDAWVQYKAPAVVQTNFWNTDFTFGIGLIPSAFITGGLVVGLLWILFFASFAYLGFKIFTRRLVQPSLMYITVSSYAGAAFLWILSVVYIPQTVLLGYAFVFTGAAVAAAHIAGVLTTKEINSEENYASGLILTVSTVVMVVVIGGSFVVAAERVFASVTLSRAVVAANEGDFEKAEKLTARAAIIGGNVRSAQLETNIGLAKLSAILNEESDDIEAQRERFQTELAKTITAARSVVAADDNYRNWLQLGDVYGQLVPLEIEGAYESAMQAYQEAQVRNPFNPLMSMRIASLAFAQGNLEEARTVLNQALEIKSNYTDAYYLLSQIAIQEEKTDEAITTTESAVLLRPDNAGLLFQLGILHYSQGSYEKVIPVLERAVAINPNYANALYFLGLSYDQTDNAEGALAVFKRIASLNPDNEEIAAIVVALESGKSALSALPQAPSVSSGQLPVENQ